MAQTTEHKSEAVYRRGTHGFSLVEMMVVVAIIAILAAVAAPRLMRSREVARAEQALIDVEILASAVQELAWDTGEWPGGIKRNVQGNRELWDLSVSKAGLLGNDGRFSNWQGPYVRDVPVDPWGNPYFFDPDYEVDGQWHVAIGSFGPNGRGRNVYDDDNIYILLN